MTRILLVAIVALFATPAFAVSPNPYVPPTEDTVQLLWDQNPETGNANPKVAIAEYRFYWRTTPAGEYTSVETFKYADLATMDNNGKPGHTASFKVPVAVTVWGVLTAVNGAGLESRPSNEVSVAIPAPPEGPATPGFPVFIKVNADGTVIVVSATP